MGKHSERAEELRQKSKRTVVVTEESRVRAAEWTINKCVDHAASRGKSTEQAHREAAEALRKNDRQKQDK